MQTVTVPWSMWYGDSFEMVFPDGWEISVIEMRGGPDIGETGIRQAFEQPIGSPRLRELARGRRDAAILVDDLTRPTPSYRILPYLFEELAAAGIDEERVRIVCAVAAHRPMTRADMIKKLGLDVVERMNVSNHNAQDNLEFYGHSSQGIPIWVNRDFARADVKIAAGMITPRGSFFGGGAKLLLPGACGRQTIFANHSFCEPGVFRDHIEEVGRVVGLEYIANPLLNSSGGVMAMLSGHPEQAYQRGVEIAKALYRTEVPVGMDIVIANAWPKDTEGTQISMGLVPIRGTSLEVVKEDGSLVITAACPEGLGYHSIMGPGTLFRMRGTRSGSGGSERQTRWIDYIYSPGLNRYDVRAQFGSRADVGPNLQFCKTWSALIEALERKHGASARVGIFPCGAIQYTSD
jgi:nickel-dependent lactate racemase